MKRIFVDVQGFGRERDCGSTRIVSPNSDDQRYLSMADARARTVTR
jgi:hypothetical protein